MAAFADGARGCGLRRPRILASRILRLGDPVDLSFLSPLRRRRLSPLQRIFFHLAHFDGFPLPAHVVFACRDGEDTLTRKTVGDFHSGGTVSPTTFSFSVYNAAPGLWSVTTGNPAPYTAIAAGRDTVKCALIEALTTGLSPTLFVAAEETEGGHGFSFLYAFDD